MRRIEHDGPAGDAQALATCRAFILGELETAGLLDETLDLQATEDTPLYLAFRGRVIIALPRFAYRLGRALHALEDSYTHTFRNPETDAVRHVGNWVDTIVLATYRPAVDGYHHVGILDDCERSDPRERGRVERVTVAAARVLTAIGDPALGRRARVEAAIDRSMVIEAGCTLENHYCNAQELDEEDDVGCAASRPGSGLALVVGALAIGLVPRRRRRPRVRLRLSGARTTVVAGGLAIAAWTATGHADTTSPDETTPSAAAGHPDTTARVAAAGHPDTTALVVAAGATGHADTAALVVAAGATGHADTAAPLVAGHPDAHVGVRTSPWHFDLRVGGALDHAAAGITAGVGREVDKFTVGAVLEWNPWFSLDTRRGSLGAFNAYATLARRWYTGPCFSLYSRAEVGSSTMLFDLVGVNRYSTGLYLAGSLLGIRGQLSERTAITFDPSHFVMPIPQLTGFPFYYRQYRITVGLEVAL